MWLFNKTKKMSKIEKREFKKIKQAKNDIKKIKSKVATTLGWIDIDEIEDYYIKLKKNKKEEYIKGIKLHPHNIFIDDTQEQNRRLNKIRLCLNRLKSNMFFNFVFSPVNADEHISDLLNKDIYEEDLECKKLIQNDLIKIENFRDTYRELEFFVMIKTKELKDMEKEFLDLINEFKYAGFEPKELNKRDYYNYMSYVFENPLINDFYYSRGIFSYENQNMVYDEETDSYKLVDNTETFERFDTDLKPIPNIKPDSKYIKKSKLAPTAFSLEKDKYVIGDKFVSNILVTQLPPRFWLGILCDFVSDPNYKVFLTTSRLDMNIASLLKKDYQEKLQELRKTRDPHLSQRLTNDLDSLQAYIEEIVRNQDQTHNVTIVFSVYADDVKTLASLKKDLKDRLNSIGFKTTNVVLMQEMLLRTVCPLFIDSKLPETIKNNLGVPLPSYGVAGLYPFIFETLKDSKGFLLGKELQNNGIILFDPFYYKNNVEESKFNQRINGNIIVVGKSGSGKTTAMNLIIRNFIKNKVTIIWIDPEDKNEIMTKKYGGSYIKWGHRNAVINVFDLKPNDVEDDDSDWLEKMWDTELAIFNVIEDVNQVIKFLYPQIDEDILTVVGGIVIKSYEKVGIKKDINGKYETFEKLTYKDMPTFTTFDECLDERINYLRKEEINPDEERLLSQLKIKMSRIMNEWSIYFNGQTQINIRNTERPIISFGTKAMFNQSENLRNALYHIMFKFSWGACLENSNYSAFVLDEGHTMILEGSTSKLISQFYRRARKYTTSMLLGTQEPRDFADPKVLTDGKAIFNNAVYKLCMQLEKDAAEDLQKLVVLNDSEKELIQSFNQGEGLFIAGNKRIPINVIATDAELIDMGAK